MRYIKPMLDQRFAVSVHLMTVMAFDKVKAGMDIQDREGLFTSDYLAGSVRSNPAAIRRLLAKLVDAGLLSSFKGKAGGVRLAKPAKQITLKDIYQAVSDNRLIHTPDKEPVKACAVSCSMKKIMCQVVDGLEKHSMSYLEKIKLSDLAKQVD